MGLKAADLHTFNDPHRGLLAFIISTRDGHPTGVLYAGSTKAAQHRAQALAGRGATASLTHTTHSFTGEHHGYEPRKSPRPHPRGRLHR